jgi:hypothetical protein
MRIQLDGREIVDAKLTLLYNSLDFRESLLAGIVFFPGAAGHEAEIVDGEYYCIEDGFVSVVEWAVYEDMTAQQGVTHAKQRKPILGAPKRACRPPSQA